MRTLIIALIASVALFGQRTQTLVDQRLTTPVLTSYTVATLPAPAAKPVGAVVTVTDAATAGSCTAGGGSALSFCRNSGSAWVSLGGAAAVWGGITGTLSNQTDLNSALAGKSDTGHIQALAAGGTNQTSWTAGRCVQVNSGGTALESAADTCGSGGGLPSQTGHANKALLTDAANPYWNRVLKSLTIGTTGGLSLSCSGGADAYSGDCTADVDTAVVATQTGDNTHLGHNDFSGAASLRLKTGTSAPASGDCDASNELGRLYFQTGDPASIPTQGWRCAQTGASSYSWQPVGYQSGTTAPATCVVGQVFFKTDASAGQNWYGCTATNAWTAQGSSVSVTTKGDLQTYSTVPARLPVGAARQVLTPDSGQATGLKWAYPSVYTLACGTGTSTSSSTLQTLGGVTPASGVIAAGDRLSIIAQWSHLPGANTTLDLAPRTGITWGTTGMPTTEVTWAAAGDTAAQQNWNIAITGAANQVSWGYIMRTNSAFTAASNPGAGTEALTGEIKIQGRFNGATDDVIQLDHYCITVYKAAP